MEGRGGGSCEDAAGEAAGEWQRGGALAAPNAAFAFDSWTGTVTGLPVQPERVVSCTSSGRDYGMLSAGGAVLCAEWSSLWHRAPPPEQPGPSDLAATVLPWAAGAASAGLGFFVALRRDGAAVCSWGDFHPHREWLGRGGDPRFAAEVEGLPIGDPVELLDAGQDYVIVVTKADEAYGWGLNAHRALALGPGGEDRNRAPVRIAALCGRGLRRLACGQRHAVAETGGGGVLRWGGGRSGIDSVALRPRDARAVFPLRSLSAMVASAAVDAAGRLWCMWAGKEGFSLVVPSARDRAAGAHAFSMAIVYCDSHVLALTAGGHFWDCRDIGLGATCRRVMSGARLPLGLVPCGGSCAQYAMLVPDSSCGLYRCRLLLLAAGRRELLPGGQMRRAALVPFLVAENFIFDDPEDA